MCLVRCIMNLISYFTVQHLMVIHHGECCTLSGFNYCLACSYTSIKHKQGGKFVSHFIADFNEMYQELEQNTPTLTYYVFYHDCQHGYISYYVQYFVQYNCFLQMLH